MEKKGKVLIRAYNPSKNPESRICPIRDESGNTLTGQGKSGYYEALTEAEFRGLEKTGILVTPETSKKIHNDFVLDLDSRTGAATWGWMQHHPYIDKQREDERTKSLRSIFYVHDEQREAELHVSKTKKNTLVLAAIYKMTLTEKRDLFTALGLGDSSTLSDELLEVALERKANSSLNTVIEVLEKREETGAKDTNARSLYHDAVNYRVIETQASGVVTFGGANGLHLGRTEDEIVNFFLIPANGETVVAIQTQVEEAKK